MSVHLAKRSACDRCREHKVRCPRGSQSSEPCTRCLRARASCVTSTARPFGRPRAVLANSRNGEVIHFGSSPTPISNNRQLSSTHHIESPLSQTANVFSWPVGDDTASLFPGVYPSTSADDNVDSFSWLIDNAQPVLGLGDEGTFFETPPSSEDSAITPDASGIYLDTPTFVQPYPSMPGDLVNSIDDNDWDLVSDTRNLGTRVRGYRFDNLLENNHANIWLARLNGIIAGQVAEINTYPVQPKDMQAVCMDGRQVTTTNSLPHILESTSNFLSFVQALRASSSSSQSSGRDYSVRASGSRTSPSQQSSRSGLSTRMSPIDMSTVLMLLAGHLQLVQLYDAIFLRTYVTLQAVPYEQLVAYQSLPEMQLSGFPVVPGTLQIKIIFQVIGHYLREIERFIGLPPEYRLYGRQESYQGILSNFESPMLLRAVMEQVNYDQRGAGMYHITSLKNNLQKVQEILEAY